VFVGGDDMIPYSRCLFGLREKIDAKVQARKPSEEARRE
jgi:hypothetical protein